MRRLRRGTGAVGALPILAGLVLASGLLRAGDGTVQRLAGRLAVATTAHAAAEDLASGDEVSALLAELKQREEALDGREAELDARAAAVAKGQERLALQLDEVEAAETELRRLLELADTAAQDDLARLSTVYENMKPAEAGALFEKMPPAFAAGFLGMMDPIAAAAIMASLTPDSAYAVSVMLAGRNADLPKE